MNGTENEVECDNCGWKLPEEDAMQNDRTGEIACTPRCARALTEAMIHDGH